MSDPLETLSVDLIFRQARPGFGDLFRLCGCDHPNFPPEGVVDFSGFDDLMISQIDDYFGVATASGEGAEVAVWLYPLVDGQVADHHRGPFDGLRLEYDVLRNPTHRLTHFLTMLDSFANRLSVDLLVDGIPSDIMRIRDEAEVAIRDWRKHGIEPGLPQAMALDT